MDQKKKIIVQEILYWRKNKLLPDHYCQFLLNLYHEGNTSETVEIEKIKKKSSMKMGLISMLISIILVSLIFVVYYFRDFHFYLQGILVSGATIMLYALTSWLYYKKSDYFHLTLGISSLSALFTMLWIGIGLQQDSFVLFLYLIAVLILWILSGFYFEADYLIMISAAGLLLAYGWYIHPQIVAKESMWFQHGVWYPLATTSIMIGFYLLKRKNLRGRIFFFTGIVAFFASELHSFFIEEVDLFHQLLFFIVHMIVVIVILLFTRKLWLK